MDGSNSSRYLLPNKPMHQRIGQVRGITVYWGLAIVVGVAATAMSAEPTFEELGSPIRIRTLTIEVVTPKADGGHVAWGWRKGDSLVGIDVTTGKSFQLDIKKYNAGNLAMSRGPDGSLFFYAGRPGRFFQYTPQGTLKELGIPAKPASYWLAGHATPGGILYVGTYPGAILVACDMNTGKITSHGQITDDKREKYIMGVAAADDGAVYCSVGLHHQELWSFDPDTGKRLQILPDSLTTKQGAPKIWTGTDGHVYGSGGGLEYRCRPDGIEVGQMCAKRCNPTIKQAADKDVVTLDGQGRLKLVAVADGALSKVQTDYAGQSSAIFSVGCQRHGKIYGGTVFPAQAFSYDPKQDTFRELEQVTPDAMQTYDIFSHPKGLFFASYMGCLLDRFDPDSPREQHKNPRRFKNSIPGHERPVQWEEGPDGGLYFGTVPAKGRLGGALVRVDPDSLAVRVWENIMPKQSIHYLASVPETGELFGCASVKGGSSAIPSLEEAEVFLWDTKTQKVTWRGKPVPGTRSYLRAIRSDNGLIVGLARRSWYVFDPVKRQVVHTGSLPVKQLHFPYLSDQPVGAKGLVVGMGDDGVFAIDPGSRTVKVLGRHDSLAQARGFLVTPEKWLYYGSDSSLWRSRLEIE